MESANCNRTLVNMTYTYAHVYNAIQKHVSTSSCENIYRFCNLEVHENIQQDMHTHCNWLENFT